MIIILILLAFGFFETSGQGLIREPLLMECYECRENPLNGNHMECEVQTNDANFKLKGEPASSLKDDGDLSWLDDNDDMWDDDDEDEEESEYYKDKVKHFNNLKSSLGLSSNSCEFVAERILQFVETQDETLAALNLDLSDSTYNRDRMQGAISTIQFQKRERINMVIAEVTLRKTSDVFSFVISDPAFDLLDLPYDSWYYVSL